MPRTRREQLTFPINVRRLDVRRIVDVTPGLRRITLGGAQLGPFVTADGIEVPALRNQGFDDHVKLIVPGPGQSAAVPPVQVEGHLDWDPPGGRPTAKDYTPRRYDAVAGELDLEFVRHGTGWASSWAERVAVGDPAWIAGPKASALLPRDVDWLLVAGDETAVPAIGRLLDELPPSARAQVFIEVADADHEVPLRTLPGVRVRWLHRDGRPAGTSDVLERAIRETEWWPGEVYAWLAGEAVTLKPIRAHLKNDREVPRDCLEVTGYWRRTEVTSGPTTTEEDDNLHDRLHALVDLTGAYAVRAAVTHGVIDRLDRGPATVTELAAVTSTHIPTLESLVRYLIGIDVLQEDGDHRVALGPLGTEIAEDEHTSAELDLDGPQAAIELSVAGLGAALRTGAPVRRPDGSTLAEALLADEVLATGMRIELEESARWPAPSIASHHDWSAYASITALGPSCGQAVASILRDNPGVSATVIDLPSALAVVADRVVEEEFEDRVHLLAQSPLSPPPGPAPVLAVQLLERLPDVDAELVLSGLAATATEVIVVETVLDPAAENVDEEMVETDLLLRCAFGSGVRTVDQISSLVSRSGLAIRDVRDVGWEMRMWVTRPVPPA